MRRTNEPSAEQLDQHPDYRKVLELSFEEMVPFVLTHIRRPGFFSYLYFGINLAALGALILMVLLDAGAGVFTWRRALGQALLGFICGSILVIPVHEAIHGLAYRILGARKIVFGADFQQFVFYVTANRYPVSGSQIYFLALSPFVVINVAAAWVTLAILPQYLLFTGVFLLSHNIMCIGDFAIANYVQKASGRVYSYDEPGKKKSYFFERTKKGD